LAGDFADQFKVFIDVEHGEADEFRGGCDEPSTSSSGTSRERSSIAGVRYSTGIAASRGFAEVATGGGTGARGADSNMKCLVSKSSGTAEVDAVEPGTGGYSPLGR
jgi:hypothetical protein